MTLASGLVTVAATIALPNGFVFPFNIAAGRFRNTPFDDVIVAGQLDGGPDGVTVYAFAGNATLAKVTLAGTTFLAPVQGQGPVVDVLLAKGPLTDWYGGQDLLVVGTAGLTAGVVTILSSDDNLALTPVSVTNVTGDGASVGCLYGLAVGNFDHRQADGQRDPGLQIATLWRSDFPTFDVRFCKSPDLGAQFDPAVRLWSVTPPTPPNQSSNWLTLLQNYEPLGGTRPSNGIALAIGDVQGRSVVLGAPRHVTVLGDIHPDIVLAIPPMHIDWVAPIVASLNPVQYPGCGQPEVPCQLNLTVMPSLPAPGVGFSSAYTFTSTASAQASRRSTTSWSIGVDLSQETKVTAGIPEESEVSVDIKQSAGFTHQGRVAKQFDTYQGITDSLSATTGFADHVFFTQRRQNIYYYPVIGHTACPAGATCPPTARQPLLVSYSGPDEILHSDQGATTLDWYQPPHEPGNVLSYPWNKEQLQLAFTDLQSQGATLAPLTTDPAPWRGTDTSQTAYTTTWAGRSQQSNSTGSVNAETYSLSITVSGSSGVENVDSIETTAQFDLNQSASVSTHNALTQTLSASTGIQVNKPGFPSVVAQNYQYSFGGYVFGLSNPNGTLQSIDLSDQNGQPVDIQTTGPLVVGFVADPLLEGLPWWAQAYTRADVALNHPARWDWTKSTQTASFNKPQFGVPPQDQAFYQMKGLFITPADANGIGPTRSTATAGDRLRITARVHNVSLVDTEGTVHVRFYGQPYSPSSGTLTGPAVLIGETQIGSIPGFQSNCPVPPVTCAPNWAFAGVEFDTTAYPDTYLVFWVIVWMPDAQGNLVPEMAGHGLTSNPGPRAFTQVTQVPVETHSNNVGLYGYVQPYFYVASAASLGAAPEGRVAIASVTADGPALLDQKVRVTARLRAVGGPRDAVPVVFYDGDPRAGGRPFHVQQIPHVRADEPYLVRAFLRPQTCGSHAVVVVAGAPAGDPATGSVAVDVVIRPVEAVEALMTSVGRLDLARAVTRTLLTPLDAARAAFHAGNLAEGRRQVAAFTQAVSARRGRELTAQQADGLVGQAGPVQSCDIDGRLTAAVTALAGTATRVGDGTDSAQVQIAGRFALTPSSGTLDLSRATLAIQSLLAEATGAGELVDHVARAPVQLVPRSGARATSAVFESQPASLRPAFRMEVKSRSTGVYDFSLKVDRAVLSRDPASCSADRPSTTELETRFAIQSGAQPLAVATVQGWQCVGRDPQSPSELRLK